MTGPPRILLDCDPGIDDAFAIFTALRHTQLAAVTTVSGNVSIDHTTRNARFVLELAGADVPVHRGAAAPLHVEPSFAGQVHGRSGLGDLDTPEATVPEHVDGAVTAILDFAAPGGAVIVATGPLTNVALALRTDPSLADRIEHLYWMGGSTSAGNVTDQAEFNAWADPHAVAEVFSSGPAISMFGLNLTHQVRMSAPHAAALDTAGTPTSRHAANFLRYYEGHGVQHGTGQPMHDPCAVLGVTHPELFEWSERHIVVHTGDDRGRTRVVDQPSGDRPIRIAERVDPEAATALIVAAATNPVSA